MKDKFLFEKFPILSEIHPLPITFLYTAQLTVEAEDGEEFEKIPDVRYVAVHSYMTQRMEQRGGFYRLISKFASQE